MLEGKDSYIIEMVEGDYGIVLPIRLENRTLSSNDKFSIKIFKEINEEPIVEKEYSNIKDNTIEFKLTKEETALLSVGKYVYDLDWFQDNAFLGNILAKKKFTVKEKAGK